MAQKSTVVLATMDLTSSIRVSMTVSQRKTRTIRSTRATRAIRMIVGFTGMKTSWTRSTIQTTERNRSKAFHHVTLKNFFRSTTTLSRTSQEMHTPKNHSRPSKKSSVRPQTSSG